MEKIVPASPGYIHLQFFPDPDATSITKADICRDLIRMPIVAWHIIRDDDDREYEIYGAPITYDTISLYPHSYRAIICSNGFVFDLSDRNFWRNIDDWIEFVFEEETKRKKEPARG